MTSDQSLDSSPSLDDDENPQDLAIDLPELHADSQPVDLTVEARAHGWRLDHYLGRLFPNHSRAQLQRIIESGGVLLNGLAHKPSRRLRVNDRLHVQLVAAERPGIEPENLPVGILYEDDALVIVNKPAGMVVHPGRGSSRGTLAAALQFHFDQLSDVAGRHRPGIVHRLDRDTTGVILIAKDNQVHQKIAAQFERREVQKEYHAIVRGCPQLDADYIRTCMTTHPKVRERMIVCPRGGDAREAVTFYRTAERLGRYSLMELHPKTGRTHQLRVHMLHLGHPIIADRLYVGVGEFRLSDLQGPAGRPAGSPDRLLIARQALHAFRLTIRHPVSGEAMRFEAPWPDDFRQTVEALRAQPQ
ncbi:MAG: RluA family pseudouridine synthase [Planctomycetota bacterium]